MVSAIGDRILIVSSEDERIMVDLSDEDAAVVELVRHEFESMGDFHAEGPNSSVTVDPADVLSSDVDGNCSDSIFYSPVRGEFMDWGFRLTCELRDAFPPGADHSMTELTPYAKRVAERLLRTWLTVDFNNYSPFGDTWISGSITDAADAKRAREAYAKVHGKQPSDRYFRAS